MKQNTRSPTLPLIGILLGVICLGASSIYALTLPGLSFDLNAKSHIAEACARTKGCTEFVARRDQTIPGRPGVEVTFVTSGNLTPSGKASLRAAVDDVVVRPSAVTVWYVPANTKKNSK